MKNSHCNNNYFRLSQSLGEGHQAGQVEFPARQVAFHADLPNTRGHT